MSITGEESSASGLLLDLRARYPEAPFLALGQTVFWDEPVKAVLRRLLDHTGPGAKMILGVHDTDYFARARTRLAGLHRFAMLAHNDGSTRNLWSAAGEISTLFGSETFPTRHDLAKCGVPLHRLGRDLPGGRAELIDKYTEAWGWRGLVYTENSDLIVHWMPLATVGQPLIELLAWGFENAMAQIASPDVKAHARGIAAQVTVWCTDYMREHPSETLSELYRYLLLKFYELLLGAPPADVEVACTAHLLRLTPETASLPRFKFVDIFLNPATREAARTAYDLAVRGSDIYTLDKFGPHALPFDVVLPGHRRGTLRVTDRMIAIEAKQGDVLAPVTIGLKRPIHSIQDLAEVLYTQLGEHVTLVGKAVSLVSMLAQEFIFVFSEEGSMYVSRTRRMNDELAAQGISLDMRPILRMRYHTWDALAEADALLDLPRHLAVGFGKPQVHTTEFARERRAVCMRLSGLCAEAGLMRKPAELFQFLAKYQPEGDWPQEAEQRATVRQKLMEGSERLRPMRDALAAAWLEHNQTKARLQAIQNEMGARRRNDIVSDDSREALRYEFRACAQLSRSLKLRIAKIRIELRQAERDASVPLRDQVARIESRAETARLELVRDAMLGIEGIPHTDHRPSVWWMPMLSPDGKWFSEVTRTADLYLEPLLSKTSTPQEAPGA